MTGSHEVRGSIPLGSTKTIKRLRTTALRGNPASLFPAQLRKIHKRAQSQDSPLKQSFPPFKFSAIFVLRRLLSGPKPRPKAWAFGRCFILNSCTP